MLMMREKDVEDEKARRYLYMSLLCLSQLSPI